MRVLYVGCNLFGQITNSSEISFDEFQRFDIANLKSVVIGHSGIILQTSDGIFLHGHGLEPRETHKVTELSLPSQTKIAKITFSDTRIFFLDECGEVYVLDFLDKHITATHKPNILLKCSDDDKIVDLVCGVGIKVALLESGKLFNVPKQINFYNKGIVQICAGNEHCILMDKDGNVFSCGRGSRGQLGHGTLDDESDPKLIDALAGIKIVQIACGSWHNVALSQDGDVYIWGWNSDGQLGLYDENSKKDDEKQPVSVIATPTLLTLDEEFLFISKIGCGSRHTILISDQHDVYGFGCNKFNQLGNGERKAFYNPFKVDRIDEDNMKVVDVVCGPAATALLLQ